MKSFAKFRQSVWFAVLVFFTGRASQIFANPTGLTVSTGQATAQQLGAHLNVTVSQLAVLNWKSFNIAAGETTSFLQPAASSIVFNIIGNGTANPSQIFGNLNANGTVILANASGFYFGPNSMIKVGGSFIATTAPLSPDFGSGATWQFTGMPPLASIVNYGQIEVGQGRSLFLIAENIQNHGSLTAPAGDVGLYAGATVLVSESPDGRGLSAAVTLPNGSVDNFGRVTADAGTIALEAKVVNQDGLLQANSVQNQNGVIELVASDSVNLGANSQIIAQGDGTAGGSVGGNVTIKAGNAFGDTAGSSLVTAGGVNGGNGGNVEISAPNIQSLKTTMDATAQAGFTGGEFLLDPVNLILGTSTAGGAINVNTAFAGFANILLQATGNITLNANTAWNLSTSTGPKTGQLVLQAGGNIIFGSNAKITDANDWSVTLAAGYNTGIGNIYLNGGLNANNNKLLSLNGSIQTAQGSISLSAGTGVYLGTGFVKSTAGGIQINALGGDINLQSGSLQATTGNIDLTALNNITVGSGYVVTTGGGNLFADAQTGNLSTGTRQVGVGNTGYTFNPDNTYSPATSYGDIGTYGGGNVTLIAGDSINPITSQNITHGATGAFGSSAGNVTLIAANQVNGIFNVANGIGTILAGTPVTSAQAAQLEHPGAGYAATLQNLQSSVTSAQNANANIGSLFQPVTLGLIGGPAGAAWNLWAANNINVLEVRNPNGSMDANAVATSGLFDYAPGAAANFWAGNAITLGSLTQNISGNGSVTVGGEIAGTAIYCPSLSLTAGAGGITINNSIVLFPSKQGSLKIASGGDLLMTGDSSPSLTMSDSVLTDYNDFGGHAGTPVHQGDLNPDPVDLNIAGNIYNFDLTVPTFANITVGGNTYNFGFSGQNISAAQTTSIKVTGDVFYPDALNQASVKLADPLPAALLDAAITVQPALASLLAYDPVSGTLTCNGQMTAGDISFLLHPTDSNGKTLVDANNVPVTLDAAQLAAVQTLYAESQTAHGLAVDGFGQFAIRAHNLDLGISPGISVDYEGAQTGPDAALQAISLYGADINLTIGNNLTMTSSKIVNGSLFGNIGLTVGGTLDVGGTAVVLGSQNAPKGIFTVGGGNITVNAVGNINVDSSRIATYDGGNINLTTQTGDINAGTGNADFVVFYALELDPNHPGQLITIPAQMPFTGILATTVVGYDSATHSIIETGSKLGNITLSAPAGSVNSSLGGIMQIAFNTADTKNNFIDINVGKDINATGSGVIGSNIKLAAGGNINGAIFGSQSININAGQNVNVTAVSGGNVNINASGTVAGTIVGGGDVSVSGDSIIAAVMGGSVSTSGDTAGASLGVPQSNTSKDVAETTDSTAATQSASGSDEEDPLNKKKKKGISLAQKVSRVTVILPPKKLSEKDTGNNPL